MAIYACDFGPIGSRDAVSDLRGAFFGPLGLFLPFVGSFVLSSGVLNVGNAAANVEFREFGVG
jgi:hypothetical protein